MAGRPPMPTALKILTGADRVHKERLNKQEPKPSIGRPKRPPTLNANGRRHWNRILDTLEEMGVLTVADANAVALLCNAMGEYMAASAEVEKRGIIVEVERETKWGTSTSIRANPAVAERADAWRRVNLMLQQFGMTAASRAKVKTEKPEVEDEFERLFKS